MTVKANLERFVRECAVYAADMLGVQDDPRAQVVRQAPGTYIHFPTINYSRGWDWSSHTTTIINNAPVAAPRAKTDKEKQDDSARVAMWIGGIAAGVMAFAVGYLYNQYADESQALNEAPRVKSIGSFHAIPEEVKSLFNARVKIHERNYTNSRNRLLASVVVLTGGVSAFVGGLTVTPMLITAGYTALFAGTVFGLLNLGLHWLDADKNQDACVRILHGKSGKPALVTEALAALKRVDENLDELESPPSYQQSLLDIPVYPEYLLPSAPPKGQVCSAQ